MALLNSGQYTSEYIPDTASDVCRNTFYCCKNVHRTILIKHLALEMDI